MTEIPLVLTMIMPVVDAVSLCYFFFFLFLKCVCATEPACDMTAVTKVMSMVNIG